MNENITQIKNVKELPLGAMVFYQVNDEQDAAYYAGKRTAYLYRSATGSLYLYVPVMQEVSA